MTAVIVASIVRQRIESLIDEMQKKNPHVEAFSDSLYQDFLGFYNENGYVPDAADVDFELATNGEVDR